MKKLDIGWNPCALNFNPVWLGKRNDTAKLK